MYIISFLQVEAFFYLGALGDCINCITYWAGLDGWLFFTYASTHNFFSIIFSTTLQLWKKNLGNNLCSYKASILDVVNVPNAKYLAHQIPKNPFIRCSKSHNFFHIWTVLLQNATVLFIWQKKSFLFIVCGWCWWLWERWDNILF